MHANTLHVHTLLGEMKLLSCLYRSKNFWHSRKWWITS